MKNRGPLPDGTALLLSFVEALQDRLDSDTAMQAACSALKHLGLYPVVKVELATGSEPPRVAIADGRAGVSQWNEKDAEVLRSVGIASDPGRDGELTPPQPRRRQPR